MPSGSRNRLAQEAGAVGELAALLRDPVYYGAGVPRGDGRLVVVIPGLFGNDFYLSPLHAWLARVGYRPVTSTLAMNAGCPDRLTERVREQLRRQMQERRGPVAFVGHSRGGMLAWALASRLQAGASHLVLLGSPGGAVAAALRRGLSMAGPTAQANRVVVDAGNRARRMLDPDCDFPACGCGYVQDLRRPLSPATRVTSIYSRDDAIVHPSASKVASGRNVEVRGTHSGLAYNTAVYRELATALGER